MPFTFCEGLKVAPFDSRCFECSSAKRFFIDPMAASPKEAEEMLPLHWESRMQGKT